MFNFSISFCLFLNTHTKNSNLWDSNICWPWRRFSWVCFAKKSWKVSSFWKFSWSSIHSNWKQIREKTCFYAIGKEKFTFFSSFAFWLLTENFSGNFMGQSLENGSSFVFSILYVFLKSLMLLHKSSIYLHFIKFQSKISLWDKVASSFGVIVSRYFLLRKYFERQIFWIFFFAIFKFIFAKNNSKRNPYFENKG